MERCRRKHASGADSEVKKCNHGQVGHDDVCWARLCELAQHFELSEQEVVAARRGFRAAGTAGGKGDDGRSVGRDSAHGGIGVSGAPVGV